MPDSVATDAQRGRYKTAFYSVLAVLVIPAILASIQPALDWWNKRTRLVVETVSSAPLLATNLPAEKLSISYNGKDVRELSRTVLRLKNDGRTVITKDDVIADVTLNLQNGKILEAKVLTAVSPDFESKLSVGDSTVAVRLALINPEEWVDIDVLATVSAPKFTVLGRIKNVTSIPVLDRAPPSRPILPKGGYAWFLAVLGAVMVGMVVFDYFWTNRRVNRAFVRLANDSDALLNSSSLWEARARIADEYGWLKANQLRGLRMRIKALEWPLSAEDRLNTKAQLTAAVRESRASVFGSILQALFVLFLVAGLAMSSAKLLQ